MRVGIEVNLLGDDAPFSPELGRVARLGPGAAGQSSVLLVDAQQG